MIDMDREKCIVKNVGRKSKRLKTTGVAYKTIQYRMMIIEL